MLPTPLGESCYFSNFFIILTLSILAPIISHLQPLVSNTALRISKVGKTNEKAGQGNRNIRNRVGIGSCGGGSIPFN
jgi:hypothetical protein